jgi:hypothetical protein
MKMEERKLSAKIYSGTQEKHFYTYLLTSKSLRPPLDVLVGAGDKSASSGVACQDLYGTKSVFLVF